MEGKQRRKRKDPESRDFSCLCGKSYLSYAAAYTHAKNKHEGDKTYIDGIKKPERQQLKRGRPKEKKQSKHTTQTAKLTLIQSAILKICDQLQGSFPHAVLQGNEERDKKLFEQRYQSLYGQHQKRLQDIKMNSEEDQDFLKALIKDFNSQVAARARFAYQILSSNSQTENPQQILRQCNIWHNNQQINSIIYSSLKQWRNYQSEPTNIQNTYHQNDQIQE